MWRDSIDICCNDIRLHFIGADLGRVRPVIDGIKQRKQFPGPIVILKERTRHYNPDRGMGVLTAVLANSRDIALDVTGTRDGTIERRVQQLNQLCLGADEAFLYGLHRLTCALWIARAAQDRPALRQGVDLALQIALRAEWLATIEISAAVPLAVPTVLLDLLSQLPRLGLATVCKGDFVAL